MMMEASAVCKINESNTEEMHQKAVSSPSVTPSWQTGSWKIFSSTHLRERLEDKTDGNHHQQHHEG